MSDIEQRMHDTQRAIAANEARLGEAWQQLLQSVRPDVQVERRVARQAARRPAALCLGAFATGAVLGWLHGGWRRLP